MIYQRINNNYDTNENSNTGHLGLHNNFQTKLRKPCRHCQFDYKIFRGGQKNKIVQVAK